MTLYELINEEWYETTYARKIEACRKIIDRLAVCEDEENDLVYNILIQASHLEEDDFFGTEGLKI